MSTFSMAPSMALIPNFMPLPSKHGPAEQAQVIIHSLFPRTISPLVPTSMKREVSSFVCILEARTPATMSPPT